MSQQDVARANFFSVWRSLTPSSRGGWNEADIGHGQARVFHDDHVVRVPNFIRQPELGLLLALVQSCEGFIGVRPLGSSFDLEEIKRIVALDGNYKGIDDFVLGVARDMWHRGATRTTKVELRRSFLRAQPAPKRAEHSMVEASEWLVWLNDDFRGGQLLFPTRGVIVSPRAGTACRWPAGLPHGIALAHEGYAFTLGGKSA